MDKDTVFRIKVEWRDGNGNGRYSLIEVAVSFDALASSIEDSVRAAAEEEARVYGARTYTVSILFPPATF